MLKDNFNKLCLAIIAVLLLLSLFFTIRASAEEYVDPAAPVESSEDSAQADPDVVGETHEVVQVSGVQVNDPTLYEKLDKMQESIDALTAALAPSDASEESAEELPVQDPTPDYTAQLSGISNQLEILSQQATAETAEPAAFEKPFKEYSTIEAIGLLAFIAFALAFFAAAIKIVIF